METAPSLPPRLWYSPAWVFPCFTLQSSLLLCLATLNPHNSSSILGSSKADWGLKSTFTYLSPSVLKVYARTSDIYAVSGITLPSHVHSPLTSTSAAELHSHIKIYFQMRFSLLLVPCSSLFQNVLNDSRGRCSFMKQDRHICISVCHTFKPLNFTGEWNWE